MMGRLYAHFSGLTSSPQGAACAHRGSGRIGASGGQDDPVCDYFVASAGAFLPGCSTVVHHQVAQVAPPFPVAALRAFDL